ncbi:MAG: YjfB family protein [Spirochaetaceae bacterium]|jgi:hypothetical protein|nr:YjfB family protein [Spirochaetaceae bacterium]
MDITALSTVLSQQKLQMEAGTAVQKMAMDGAKAQGAGLVDMMQSAQVITDPALGSMVDTYA